MEEYIELIENVDKILNIAYSIQDDNERNVFLKKNINVLYNFKDSLDILLRLYQFKVPNDKSQNEIADKIQNNIIRLLDIKGIFEIDDEYPYFKSSILDSLSYYDGKFAFSLQYEKDMTKVESALQYMQDRKKYVDVLRENNFFEGQDLNDSSAKKFISDEFEQSLYGHALICIKNNYLDLSQEEIAKLLDNIDNSGFIEEIFSKENSKMNFYEKNLVYQYCDTIVKMKSIFTPNKLKDDTVIKQFWKGNIKENETIEHILNNTSLAIFDDFAKQYEEESSNEFISTLSDHFSKIDLPDENISYIMKYLFDSNNMSFEYASFLSKIDIPKDYNEFLDSPYSENYKWLKDVNTFQSLKKCEDSINDARKPFLPCEYYIKKLDKLAFSPNVNEHFVDNLITLLHSNYYSQEEKDSLIEALKRNNLYNEYITDEKILFEKDNAPNVTLNKVKKAYYSGQVVPIEIAKDLFNKDLSNEKSIDKITLQASVQSIICNTLKENGIDYKNKVFFGDGKGTNLGHCNNSDKYIWIDDFLLEKYMKSTSISDKVSLFDTMFHEMQHAIQYSNIEKGNIDYLTYNFIKEEITENYDFNFYKENYSRIYMEADARKEGILGTLDFLNSLNPEYVKSIGSKMEKQYISENTQHTVYKDSVKSFAIGKDSTIDISEYIGLLIKNNPEILIKNPILSIEYNKDGTKKDINTLIQEFEKSKSNDFEQKNNYSNMYSIYYGLFDKIKDHDIPNEADLRNKLSNFMQEEKSLITMEDMYSYYHEVDKAKLDSVYSRLYYLTKASKEGEAR